MNTNKKIILIAAVVVSAALLLLCGGRSEQKVPRTISVSGECLTTAPKDRTAITLSVKTLDKSADESMKQASAKMAEIKD